MQQIFYSCKIYLTVGGRQLISGGNDGPSPDSGVGSF